MNELYRTFSLGALLASACLILGCSGGTGAEGATGGELLLYCGAGIRPPVDELVRAFEAETGTTVSVDYAGSEVLLSRIRLNRAGDLYMPGDRSYLDQAAGEGMVLARRPICLFVPTILVNWGNPKGIGGLNDLVRPGVRLGLGDSRACAIGRMTRKVFEKNAIPWEQVEKNLIYQSLTVNELGLQIQAGSLDAVIVWDAIAKNYRGHGEEVPLAWRDNILSFVDLGILSFSENRQAAQRFLDFAGSERGERIFRKHAYRIDPPPALGDTIDAGVESPLPSPLPSPPTAPRGKDGRER